ncbi:MAG: hypothetical protein U1F36_10270 [Planctomycetota bacterium]
MTCLRLLTLLTLALPLAAQLPPGHFLAVGTGPLGTLVSYEPLAGSFVPLLDPNQLLRRASRAVVGATPDVLIAAIDAGTVTGSEQIAEVQLSGRQILQVSPRTRDLQEPVVALDRHSDGALAFATATRAFLLLPGAANPVVVATAPTAVSFVAIRIGPNRISTLGSGALGASTLAITDRTSGGTTYAQIAINAARGMELDPLRGGLLIGDEGGNLWLLDLVRFLATPLGVGAPAPIHTIEYDSDRALYELGTPLGLFEFDGTAVTPAQPAPDFGSLDYLPYQSQFSTYGQGCASATVRPTISASGRPYPGSVDFTLRLGGGMPSSAAFLALGLLPALLPLDPIGMPNCRMLLQPLDLVAQPTNSLGNAGLRLTIPPDASLAGAVVYAQWVALATGANAAGLLLSDAGRIQF